VSTTLTLATTTSAFPRTRWLALVWLAVWGATYAVVWGWANFLHLCNIAVILTCLGIWRGNSLLISSQAVSSLLAPLFWDLDVFWRLVLGGHLIGGTEYMWDSGFPLAVRLLSLYHVVWPLLMLWAVRRVRYEPRALFVQSAIAIVVLGVSRYVRPELNLNFAHRDPFFNLALSPGILHLAVTAAVLFAVAYWPTHLLLRRLFPEVHEGQEEPRR
jgi:hypothetical protein